jgi:hypothetical protein
MKTGSKQSQTELTFNGLHGVISQRTELFITTTVRTSKPNPVVHTHKHTHKKSIVFSFNKPMQTTASNRISIKFLVILRKFTYATLDSMTTRSTEIPWYMKCILPIQDKYMKAETLFEISHQKYLKD